MEPRRSEGPEPGSHSSVGCHSETINKSQISEVLSLLVASWYSTCSGHKVTLMSPLMPFDLNIDSWDPVVKERIVLFSCMCREVSVALHSASFCNWCILPWRHPGCRASPQRKHNPLWAPCRSSPSWLQEHWTSTWGTACKEKKNKNHMITSMETFNLFLSCTWKMTRSASVSLRCSSVMSADSFPVSHASLVSSAYRKCSESLISPAERESKVRKSLLM